MLPLLIAHSIIIGLLIILGIIFSCGKGAFLIAGYNTASKAEKNRIDEKLLCKFMGKLMFSLAGCFVIIALGAIFDIVLLLIIGLALFIILIIFAVVYANKDKHFKR